ncbi:MAG: hypothetical protein ACI4U2_03290, partial [Christensenellaceae bacterium]
EIIRIISDRPRDKQRLRLPEAGKVDRRHPIGSAEISDLRKKGFLIGEIPVEKEKILPFSPL